MNKKRKILIGVAPVAHEGKALPNGVTNPVEPKEIANQVIECAKARAAMVHLHVRNKQGQIVDYLDVFNDTVSLIRKETDIIIEVSTGGVSELSLDQRCIGLNNHEVSLASLNMGSLNFGEGVYINTLPDIRYWAHKMIEKGVKPELEIFDLAMLNAIETIGNEGLLLTKPFVGFCLGVPNSLHATADNLYILKSRLPSNANWGLIHEGMTDFSLHAAALALGASFLRVGFEDGFYYGSNKLAYHTQTLVKALVDFIRQLGFEPMTIQEAKSFLEL